MKQRTLTRTNRDQNRSVIFHFLKVHPEFEPMGEARLHEQFKAELQAKRTKIQSLGSTEFQQQFKSFLTKKFGPNAGTAFQEYVHQKNTNSENS